MQYEAVMQSATSGAPGLPPEGPGNADHRPGRCFARQRHETVQFPSPGPASVPILEVRQSSPFGAFGTKSCSPETSNAPIAA